MLFYSETFFPFARQKRIFLIYNSVSFPVRQKKVQNYRSNDDFKVEYHVLKKKSNEVKRNYFTIGEFSSENP